MDEQTRLLTLAHLENGTRPAEAAERTGVSYAAALKLRKELAAAKEKNGLLKLFRLDKTALEILLESVTKQMTPAIEAFNIGEAVEGEVATLKGQINGGTALDEELQRAGSALANKITQTATVATSADTVLSLAKALCELQRSFFGDGSSNGNLSITSFEKHLRD